MKKELKKWLISFAIMVSLTLLIYGGCMIFAYNPTLSDAFDNAFGGNFLFRGNPKGMFQFALMQSIFVALPVGTLMFRGVIWLLDNDYVVVSDNEKESNNN